MSFENHAAIAALARDAGDDIFATGENLLPPGAYSKLLEVMLHIVGQLRLAFVSLSGGPVSDGGTAEG